MTRIYFKAINQALGERDFKVQLELLPSEMHPKILAYHRWQDSHASLYGKLLLKEGLNLLKRDDLELANIQVNEFGKPFLDGNIHFNISHTDHYVVCAVSDHPVGIDIERVHPIEPSDYYRFLGPHDSMTLEKAEDKIETFFKIWTQKESILKLLGTGINSKLPEIKLWTNHGELDGQIFHTQSFYPTKDLIITVALLQSEKRLQIQIC
jgi:4'-phosphopantetheinyl transferase